MILPTQIMENTEVEYISIYDKPKRGRGKPKTCKLSDEEKRERKNAIAKNIITITMSIVSFNNVAINNQNTFQKIKFRKPIIFWLSGK